MVQENGIPTKQFLNCALRAQYWKEAPRVTKDKGDRIRKNINMNILLDWLHTIKLPHEWLPIWRDLIALQFHFFYDFFSIEEQRKTNKKNSLILKTWIVSIVSICVCVYSLSHLNTLAFSLEFIHFCLCRQYLFLSKHLCRGQMGVWRRLAKFLWCE